MCCSEPVVDRGAPIPVAPDGGASRMTGGPPGLGRLTDRAAGGGGVGHTASDTEAAGRTASGMVPVPCRSALRTGVAAGDTTARAGAARGCSVGAATVSIRSRPATGAGGPLDLGCTSSSRLAAGSAGRSVLVRTCLSVCSVVSLNQPHLLAACTAQSCRARQCAVVPSQ